MKAALEPATIRLSARERQVCERVTLGMTNSEIASDLGISPATVDSYLRRCFSAFGVNNRVVLALRFSDWKRPT